MKFLARSFLIASLLMVCWLTLGTQSATAVAVPKKVLVLSPFQIDLSTNLIAAQALREEFGKAADLSLDVFYEYLDLNRFTDEAYLHNIFDLLKSKYEKNQIDLVIVGSEAMLKLWLAQRAEILPNTPIVFFDVFTEHLNTFNLPANVTGASGVEDCETTVRWVLGAKPGIDEIVLVGGVGKIEQGFLDHFQKLKENMKGRVKFTELSGLPLAEILQQVSKLPKTAIILYHPMFEDAAGNKYRPLEVVRELAAVSSVPVVGGYDQFIGTGIIGGYMYSIDQQARDAAQMGLRVLRGEKINTIPIAQNESNRFIFDHPALLRFDISLSLLPSESIVKNRQYSFWELYQPQIIATGTGIAILLLLVVFLFGLTQQLNRTRLALAHLNANLETEVQERTAMLNETNAQLQIEIGERKQANEQLVESERRLTTLMSNLPGMVYRCRNDQAWTMEFVSEGCLELTGYKAENLIENSVIAFGQMIHASDQTQVWDNVQGAVSAGTAYDLVYRIVTASNVEKWVMERGRGVYTDQGELVALEGFINDITEQKFKELNLQYAHAAELTQANEAIRQFEINFETVVNNANDGITIASATGETVFANVKFAEIVGYPLAELSHTSMKDLAHPDEYPMLAERLRLRLAGEPVPNPYETAIRQKDGRKVPIELSASKILWKGQPADLVIIRDISERKRSEELIAIRLRLMEFADSHSLEELLQRTLDEVCRLVNSPIGFYHFVEADQVTLSLQAWSTRTEKEFCAAEGKGLHYNIDRAGVWVDAVHQKRPVIHNDYLSLPHKKGLPEGHTALIRELVVPILLKDKVVAVLGVGNKPTEYFDQDVKLVAYLADVAWEIAARKIIELELQEYRDHLEQLVYARTADLVTANERLAQEVHERKVNLAKYTTLFEAFPLGVSIIGTDGKILESNQEAERILGLSRREQELRFVNGSEWRIVRPDGTPMLAEEYASVRALKEQRRIENIEMGIVKDDQQITWINVTAAPIPADGLGAAVVYSDISERKRMEAALRESEELKKGILNSLNAHIAVIDAAGNIISVNEPWRNFAKANGVGNLIGTVEQVNYLAVLRQAAKDAPQEIAPILDGIEEVMNGIRPSFQMEYSCDSPTENRWFNMMVAPLASGQGGVVITHENITERKKDEQALRESKSSLQAVLESTADGILTVDPESRVLFVNERFVEMWKIPAAVLDSKVDAVLLEHILEQLINPQDFLEKVRDLYQSGNESFDILNFKDGRVFERFSRPLLIAEKASGRVWSFRDVTERKQAEEQLRQSEEKFRGLLDSQEGRIMIYDFEGVHHYVNQNVVDELIRSGISQNIIGKRLHDIYPASTADWQLKQIRKVFATGQGLAGDFENFLEGQHSWWHLNLQPIRDASGQVVQVMVNSLNISDRKRMEAELRDSERRTATILRLSPAVIGVSTAAEGRYTDVNDAFERVLGYSRAEAVGHTSFDLNLWADSDTRSLLLREIQEHGRAENLEIRLRRKSGEVFPALIFITPITLHDTQHLLTMMMDITERNHVEEQLRETRDALQAIIYSAPLAILTLDAEDRVTMWNPAAEAMFGWSDREILGQINPTVPENKVKEYNALRQATLNGMAFSNLDTVRQKQNGSQFPVSLSVAPLRGHQSQVIGRMHVIADITERKKLQEDLRQQATTDELTRISNRRHFMELATSEIKRAVRLKRPPAIALIDIDHFKQINDTYGHAAGDQALVAFTKIFRQQIREIDVFARFGGDEFVLLLPETSQEQAYQVVERVRSALETQPVSLDGHSVYISISSGITSLSDDQESIDTLLGQADQALYSAKEAGRNKVVRYDQLGE